METFSRLRFWVEAVLATGTGVLFVVTLVHRDWIETVFGVDPDQHSGSLEWLIVAALLVVTLMLSALARSEWHKVRLAASAH